MTFLTVLINDAAPGGENNALLQECQIEFKLERKAEKAISAGGKKKQTRTKPYGAGDGFVFGVGVRRRRRDADDFSECGRKLRVSLSDFNWNRAREFPRLIKVWRDSCTCPGKS